VAWPSAPQEPDLSRSSSGAWRRLLSFVFLALPVAVVAQLAPNLQLGLDWLSQQVRPTGVVGEWSSIGTPLQVRAETVHTLQALAALPNDLAAAVGGGLDGDEDTETLSRRVVATNVLGNDAPAQLTQLLQRQNADPDSGSSLKFKPRRQRSTPFRHDSSGSILKIRKINWIRGQVSNLNPLIKEVRPFRDGSFLWNFEDTETHQLAGRLRRRS